VSQTDHRCETKNGDQQMKYDRTTAAVSLTVFNLALDTGPGPLPAPPPRSPALGPPPPAVPRPPRALMTRRGTREDPSNAPSTVVHAVPVDAVDDDGHLVELVDVRSVDLDPDVIRSRRSSSGRRHGVLLSSTGAASVPQPQAHCSLFDAPSLRRFN